MENWVYFVVSLVDFTLGGPWDFNCLTYSYIDLILSKKKINESKDKPKDLGNTLTEKKTFYSKHS